MHTPQCIQMYPALKGEKECDKIRWKHEQLLCQIVSKWKQVPFCWLIMLGFLHWIHHVIRLYTFFDSFCSIQWSLQQQAVIVNLKNFSLFWEHFGIGCWSNERICLAYFSCMCVSIQDQPINMSEPLPIWPDFKDNAGLQNTHCRTSRIVKQSIQIQLSETTFLSIFSPFLMYSTPDAASEIEAAWKMFMRKAKQ